jgi:predicted Zn finger-like uncharacterized protein
MRLDPEHFEFFKSTVKRLWQARKRGPDSGRFEGAPMRLTCPNCDAQYEVDASLVPRTGRDVQCSNCGNTWFQPPAGADKALARDLGRPVAAEDEADAATQESEEPKPAPAPERPARKADEKAIGILREEAERELSARQAERPTESDAAVAAATVAARTTSSDDAENGSRRGDLLPDIDEINSTLNATTDRPGEEPTADVIEENRKHRSGFRMGFSAVLLIVAILIGLYLFADTIAATVPALADTMAAYVDWGNSVRLWFDDVLESSVETLSRLIVSVTGSG